MRPISLRFRCFGPYKTEQFVDFTQLEKSGVFLITGETGAGKTTILDAMCYALYGRSSGGIRGDLTAMRCKLADRTDETFVEFIFEVNARRYCFTRSLKFARKNINDSHNCLVWEDDVFVPLLENPKATYVNKKAEELIGLTYDQFRQVIILPQGQFEKLLISDSVQKEEILVSLFRAENWQRIADEMYRRVTERDAALKEAYTRVTMGLAAYECTSIEALHEMCEERQTTLAALREQHKALERVFAVRKTSFEQALVDYKDFEERQKRRQRVEQLMGSAEQYAAVETSLRLADAAESIRVPYETFAAADQALADATKQCERATIERKHADEALAHAESARRAHEAGKEEYEAQKRLVTLYENAREIYRVLGEKQAQVEALAARVFEDHAAERAARATFDAAHRTWLEAMEDQQKAINAYQSAQKQYLSCIGSVLAEQLLEGEACPVCGSTVHPAPAPKTAAYISEAALETLNKAVRTAGDAVTKAANDRTAAENALQTAVQTLSACEQALAVAKTAYENVLLQKIAGIDTAAALETVLAQLATAQKCYDRAEAETLRVLSSAAGNATAAAVTLDAAKKAATEAEIAYEKAVVLWQTALEKAGFDSTAEYAAASLSADERNEKRTVLVTYKTDTENAFRALEEQEALLEGRTCPDIQTLKAQYEESALQQQQLTAALALAEDKLQTMRRDAAELAASKAEHDEQRAAVDADMEFVKRLQGRTGVSLQRYVLGVMLTSITIAANRLLQHVHGGRYQLYRTDEIAGSSHKGGLELEVYDAHHNERRSVTTLSGGEKFLVSLGLAIGLSTVVQAQGGGVRLEAMFIDEGFGSLDRDSIADALEILQGVHRGKGVVGIISHVDRLAETIPAKITITKGRDGSHCHVSV